MKRFLLPLVYWFLTATASAQIPNAGFEKWDSQPVLLNWVTNSYPLTLPAWDPYIVKQDTDSYSGNYSANFYANGQFKAFAITTFPVTYRPISLNAWVKYNFAPCVNDNGYPEQDTISIDVELLNGISVVDSGHWNYHAPGFLANYQQLTIPITQNATVFDSCRITIRGGKVFGGCGFVAAPTQFYVDHLELKYSSATTCIDSTQICLPGCGCFAIYNPVCGCDGKTYSNSCEAYVSGVTSWSSGVCQPCVDTSVIDLNVMCPAIYDPVCGCNGVTYGSSCEAYNHYGITNWTNGPCQLTAGTCEAAFTYNKHIDTVWFANSSAAPSIISYAWDFGDGQSGDTSANPAHVYMQDGTYIVCLSLAGFDSLNQPCFDNVCDTLTITHNCIDTSIINCTNPALCCDFVPQILVCGCDSVTYNNACEAVQMHGVTQYYAGSCVTGINDNTGLLKSVSVYPNPATENTVVSFDLLNASKVSVRILSVIGETIAAVNTGGIAEGHHTLMVPVEQLSSGVYILQLEVDGRIAAMRKLIKN